MPMEDGGKSLFKSEPVQRINDSLRKLRDELKSMRNQDIQLLKQLIHISDTIQTLAKSWDSSSQISRIRSCQILSPIGYNVSKNVLCQRGVPVPSRYSRRQSAPELNLDEDVLKVEFNIEDISISSDELSDDFDVDDEEEEIIQSTEEITKMAAFSSSYCEPPLVLTLGKEMDFTDDNYKEILNMNVKLWKHVQVSGNGANFSRMPITYSGTSNSDLICSSKNTSQSVVLNIQNIESHLHKTLHKSQSSKGFLQSSNTIEDTNNSMKGSKSSSNLEIIKECEDHDQIGGMRHFQTLSDLHSEFNLMEQN